MLFKRIKIFFAVNLEALIELFNKKGIEAKWLSRKETHKLLNNKQRYKPFMFKDQAIKINVNGNFVTLGDSFLIYLMLDNITPSSLVERYKCLK